MTLPAAARPFVTFAARLRAHGFPVAPDQTIAFLQAVELLGPRDMTDIHRAAIGTLAPPHELRPEFDALFRAHFLSQTLAAPAVEGDENEMIVHDARPGALEPPDTAEPDEAGGHATPTEALGRRRFDALGEAETLRRFARQAPERLPRRCSRRREASRHGHAIDLRAALREAVRRDGELLELPRLRRRTRQRRILLLVDISGSMKAQTERALRFAHALTRAAERVETFTFGTRLTRVTPALRLRNRDQALANAAALAPDWDGGTRIGDALAAFLAVPRFAGFARGALVVVLSDGLERGDPASMIDAVTRLSRLAWAVHWLTPLAADPGYTPRTAALEAVLPHLDHLGDGSSTERIASHLLDAARAA